MYNIIIITIQECKPLLQVMNNAQIAPARLSACLQSPCVLPFPCFLHDRTDVLKIESSCANDFTALAPQFQYYFNKGRVGKYCIDIY